MYRPSDCNDRVHLPATSCAALRPGHAPPGTHATVRVVSAPVAQTLTLNSIHSARCTWVRPDYCCRCRSHRCHQMWRIGEKVLRAKHKVTAWTVERRASLSWELTLRCSQSLPKFPVISTLHHQEHYTVVHGYRNCGHASTPFLKQSFLVMWMHTPNGRKCSRCLQHCIGAYGLPEQVMAYNGLQFIVLDLNWTGHLLCALPSCFQWGNGEIHPYYI